MLLSAVCLNNSYYNPNFFLAHERSNQQKNVDLLISKYPAFLINASTFYVFKPKQTDTYYLLCVCDMGSGRVYCGAGQDSVLFILINHRCNTARDICPQFVNTEGIINSWRSMLLILGLFFSYCWVETVYQYCFANWINRVFLLLR